MCEEARNRYELTTLHIDWTDPAYLYDAKCENVIGWLSKIKPMLLDNSKMKVVDWQRIFRIFYSRGSFIHISDKDAHRMNLSRLFLLLRG